MLDECPDCNGAGYLRYDVLYGHVNFGQLIKCGNQFHNESRLQRLARISNLNQSELTCRLSDINCYHNADGSNLAMLDTARRMIDNPHGWLFIWGGPGNAKSEVLIAIVNELNEAGRGPAVYNKFVHLLDYIREVFGPGSKDSYPERFCRLLSAPALAIDEFDKVRLTEFADEFRFNFLDERYRQAIAKETVTIFASNDDPKSLPGPIYDRVRDGRFKVVHNTAPSARPVMEWE